MFKFQHFQSLPTCDKFLPISQLLEAKRLSSFFLRRCGNRRVVLGGPVHGPHRCHGALFSSRRLVDVRAHLHGAISYVLRRPITRVDSGADRKPCRAPPNQTPHEYPDVAALLRLPPFHDTLQVRTLARRCSICCRGLWAYIAEVKR